MCGYSNKDGQLELNTATVTVYGMLLTMFKHYYYYLFSGYTYNCIKKNKLF